MGNLALTNLLTVRSAVTLRKCHLACILVAKMENCKWCFQNSIIIFDVENVELNFRAKERMPNDIF